MSQPRMCIFVAGRQCPFNTSQVPFKTCELCIEAWKTDVAMKRQEAARAQQMQAHAQAHGGVKPLTIAAPDLGSQVENGQGLREIDALLKEGSIGPGEYVTLRKRQIEALREIELNGQNSRLKLDYIDEPIVNEIRPAPRSVRVVVVVKTMLGKQIYSSPGDWEIPKAFSDNVIKSIFKLTEKKKAHEIKLRAGDYKLACIRHEKDKFALMVMDADEDFETYEDEIERVSGVLDGEKLWALALKKLD